MPGAFGQGWRESHAIRPGTARELDRRRTGAAHRVFAGLRAREESESSGRHARGRGFHHALSRGSRPALSRDRAAGDHAERGRQLRGRRQGAAPRAQRAHRLLPGGRGERLDPGSLGWRDCRRKALWPRRRRHEDRHHRLHHDLPAPASDQGAAQGPAHAHVRLRRGDLRALGRALPDGASSGGTRRLPPERRARQPLFDPLRREGPALARVHGAHAAYTHYSKSATKLALQLASELEAVTAIEPNISDNVRAALEHGRATMDKAMGAGAADTVSQVTLNIGTIRGGLKVNMVPGECVFEADIRLPVGVEMSQVLEVVARVLADFPEATMREMQFSPPSWCDPNGEMVEILQRNVAALKGFTPVPIVSLGGTDARLWRYRNVPAYVYGPFPRGMGSTDEHVEIEEFLHVVRVHVLSAYDYLMRA